MTSNNRRFWFWLTLGIAFFVFLYLIRSILLPFVVGGMMAYFLDPAADWLEERKFSRVAATSTLTLSFFAVLVGILIALAPLIYEQFMELMKSMPGYVDNLRTLLGPRMEKALVKFASPEAVDGTKQAVSQASSTLFDLAQNFVTGLLASGVAIINVLTLLFLTPVVTFYLLRDFDGIVAHVDSLLPRESAPTIRQQMREIDRTIAGYLRGQVNVCLILAAFYAIALSLTGLKYGILIGMAGGLLSFIPFIGAVLTFGVAMLIAVFQFDSFIHIAAVAAVFGIGQILEGNVLVPKLIGDKVGLHPAWVIFGMLAGGALLGFVGVLLAVPITAVIGVLVRFAAGRYRESMMYHGDAEVKMPDAMRLSSKRQKKALPPKPAV